MPKSQSSRSLDGSTHSPRESQLATPGARRWRARLWAGIVLVVAVVVTAVVVLTQDDGTSGALRAAEVDMTHVHGLGVDPGDGALLAGTHHGLVRLPADGEARVVANRVQDFMGFTVVGPGHYLASGHPGPGQEGPSSLGLVQSTDAGQTWQTLSLAGEADFHALEARHGLTYGLNALTGEFMVSADQQTWEARSRIPMADFAVSPQDAGLVMGTTQQGPVVSRDGGRTFELLPEAPLLQLVSWGDDGTVLGVEPSGTVHASTDQGQTWQRRGSVASAPLALTATTTADLFVAIDGAILASQDGGKTFEPRYEG